MRRSLTRSERISKKSDLDEIFKFGTRSVYDGIKLLVKKNRLQTNRFVVSVKKGVKSAVVRNREKRLVKEAYRHLKPGIIPGNDFIFIIIKTGARFNERIHQLEVLFRRLHLFMKEHDLE
jgi:ribonuclease P protein component